MTSSKRTEAKFRAFSHFAFTVSDIETSVRWYCNVLGLELQSRQRQENAYTRRLVGLEDAILEVAELGIVGSPTGAKQPTLELVEYVRPSGDRITLEPQNVGVSHVSFVVDDIAGEYSRLRAEGVAFRSEPVEITEGMNKGGWVCYFSDPDGLILELFQPGTMLTMEEERGGSFG